MIRKKVFKIINFTLPALPLLSALILFHTSAPDVFFTVEKPAVTNEKFERDNELQADADALLALFDEMPPVAVYLKDEPVLKSGTSVESGVAYTQCAKHQPPIVFVKKVFYENTNRKQLINILKHELTHAWLCRRNMMSGHDENFRRKFTAIGGFGN